MRTPVNSEVHTVRATLQPSIERIPIVIVLADDDDDDYMIRGNREVKGSEPKAKPIQWTDESRVSLPSSLQGVTVLFNSKTLLVYPCLRHRPRLRPLNALIGCDCLSKELKSLA